MSKHSDSDVNFRRRRLMTSLSAASAMAGLGLSSKYAHALPSSDDDKVLTGTEFDLEITQAAVNITGVTTMATIVNGQLPGPTLYWREGDTVTLRVTNRLRVTTSIHWHGILLPPEMDGVPGISYSGSTI